MSDSIDGALARLKEGDFPHDLGRLEAAVWARIEARRSDAFGGVRLQLAVSCGALLLGLAIAHIAGGGGLMPPRLASEIVVLSDDGAMAPSVRLEGGS